jgi:hypothetical protein
MKNKTYKFYSDSGHGWLAVKRIELINLGIADKISHYSYQRGGTVYLEEDCDVSTFFKAKGWVTAGDWKQNVVEGKHQDRSPIRSYDSYKPFEQMQQFFTNVEYNAPEHGCGHMQGRGAA